MSDYIRREDASNWLKQYGQDVLHGKYKFSLMYIWKNIMDLPSADVVQVVHAYWIQTSAEDEDGNAYYSCSNCGSGESHNPIVEVPYCWKCGAKMDAHGEE